MATCKVRMSSGSDKLTPRAKSALARVRVALGQEGLCTVGYDRSADVFYFRGQRSLARDLNSGYVLSVTDAETGSIQSIYEPANF